MHLELKLICKRFGQIVANRDVSVSFPEGRIIAVLGENGAGKSTLMKIISGSLKPDSGTLILNGKETTFNSPLHALQLGIGMLHQDPLVFPTLTIAENFLLGFSGNASEFLLTCERIAIEFGFRLNLQSRVADLTIGECQQLEIVRLLAHNISLLILDEPTTGISAQQKRLLFNAIHALALSGKTIIFVTHKLEDANQLCSQAVIMRQGKVAFNCDLPCPSETLVKYMFGRNLEKISLCRAPEEPYLLSVDHLAYDERNLRIEDVTFSMYHGEVIGLAGIEGSGQNGLLRVLSGYKPAAAGKITFENSDLSHFSFLDKRLKGIHLLPADRLNEGLIPGLAISEHTALADQSDQFFIDESSAQHFAQERIRHFNIKGFPSTLAGQLSGGNQQRLMLSLLSDPSKLLLLEHPTRGLDVESALAVWKILQHRCQAGTSIMFTSAEFDELLEYSDRIFVFYEGRMSASLISSKTNVDELGLLIGGKGF